MREAWVSVLMAGAFMATSCASVTGDAVSLCELVADPGRFERVPVVIHAQLDWAMPHPMYLSDPSCGASGVPLVFDVGQPGAGSLIAEMRRHSGRTLAGRFAGHIVTSDQGVPGIYFRLTSASTLRVVP